MRFSGQFSKNTKKRFHVLVMFSQFVFLLLLKYERFSMILFGGKMCFWLKGSQNAFNPFERKRCVEGRLGYIETNQLIFQRITGGEHGAYVNLKQWVV